jgi:hypothetical protein
MVCDRASQAFTTTTGSGKPTSISRGRDTRRWSRPSRRRAAPSAGDFVIYGIDAPEGHVSFIPEVGAHAGASPDEMHTFIVHPAKVTLPSQIHHPVQLYDHFIRYQDPS